MLKSGLFYILGRNGKFFSGGNVGEDGSPWTNDTEKACGFDPKSQQDMTMMGTVQDWANHGCGVNEVNAIVIRFF